MDQKAMFKLSYGLFVLTARQDGKDNGCIVNTVQQVTDTPLRISVTVNKQHLTHDMIKATGLFNVSILSELAKMDTIKHRGFVSGRQEDKMVGVTVARSANGLIYLPEQTNAYISAKVAEEIDLGTHTMFIADVTDAEMLAPDERSVTYAFYQENIKPKPAPQKKKGWVCTVCGYIYEGDPLPPDFTCPWCLHPASDFVPLDQ